VAFVIHSKKSFVGGYIFCIELALIQIAAPFRGWIVYQIDPRNFRLGYCTVSRGGSSAQSANVIIKANFPL
jgi:hypothetical protein